MAALAARQTAAVRPGAGPPAGGEERLFFSGDGVLGFEGEAGPAALAGVEGVVIDTLCDEYGVGKAEVDAYCNGGGCEVGCESPCREIDSLVLAKKKKKTHCVTRGQDHNWQVEDYVGLKKKQEKAVKGRKNCATHLPSSSSRPAAR